MIKTSPFGPIRELRKLSFSESISGHSIMVEFNEVGWLTVEQYKGLDGAFFPKKKYVQLSLTVEDARNLIKCLQEFAPEPEYSKGPCVEVKP